ncbi:hypothetical protein [Alcaligenes faecalis]|uniref:hypothetical protein n=1 Tax=Alcaligenes faecalis TaxID=511 RepID=UPI002933AC63|nr:hypothetical protein [Alcaligenes faecalis]MDV2116538.1 hypothetical protein [Alcaligenes faecalis]
MNGKTRSAAMVGPRRAFATQVGARLPTHPSGWLVIEQHTLLLKPCVEPHAAACTPSLLLNHQPV